MTTFGSAPNHPVTIETMERVLRYTRQSDGEGLPLL